VLLRVAGPLKEEVYSGAESWLTVLPSEQTAWNRMTSEGPDKHLQDLQRFERLKAAVELIVGDLSGEVSEQLGVEFCRETIATLALITVGKIERSAADLESFANHAKRTTVTTEDVKLLTRRNIQLTQYLATLDNESKAAATAKRKAKNDGKKRPAVE